jgi:regulatory LuxR family protein
VLVLSEHTVHRHVANILAKLGATSRAAAVAAAGERGLIPGSATSTSGHAGPSFAEWPEQAKSPTEP